MKERCDIRTPCCFWKRDVPKATSIWSALSEWTVLVEAVCNRKDRCEKLIEREAMCNLLRKNMKEYIIVIVDMNQIFLLFFDLRGDKYQFEVTGLDYNKFFFHSLSIISHCFEPTYQKKYGNASFLSQNSGFFLLRRVVSFYGFIY